MSEALDETHTAPARRFKPYPEYKDSGVDWLGPIPAHWDARRLKFVAPVSDERVYASATDQPYVALEHIESWTGRLVSEAESQHPESTTTSFRAGDVLFGKLRPYLAKVLCAGFSGHCSAELLVLRGNGDVDPKELAYQLLSEGFIRWIDSMTYGTKMPRANPAQLQNTFVAIPSHTEQRGIAGFLDRETGKIDALILKQERLIALLAEKRTALITHAVTKGLDPTAPLKDSGIDWLGQIPTHWAVKRLKFIAQVGNGSTPSRENAAYWGGKYPWLNSGVVNLREVTEASDFVTDLALAECHLPRVCPPAVLVGITGEGKTRAMATVLRIEATINQHLAFILPFRRDCDAEYTRYVLHSAYQFLRDESGGGGSTKGALTCDQLKNVSIPFPPEREQPAIAEFLDRETGKLDALIAKVREAIERLEEYSTALISAAVTGKIDVRGLA